MIPWDDFRLVKAIADARSLTGAAQTLGLDHSTVFRRLGDLEKRLGVRLFERRRQGYGLTPPGEDMAALAGRMDEDVAAFERRLAGRDATPSGEVRVTTSDTLFLHLLLPILAEFRLAFPAIRLDMALANPSLNLSKRDADIAVRATDHPPETLVGRRIATIAWAIYGRRDAYPEARVGLADKISLREATWVSLGDDFGHLQAARFVREAASPERIAIKVNGVLGLSEAVEAGIGIGPLPCFIADPKPGLIRLTPAQPGFSGGLWLLTHPDLRASPRIRAFMDFTAAAILPLRPLLEGERPRRAESRTSGSRG